MAAKTEVRLSDTIRAMITAWPELKLNEGGQLVGDECAFVTRRHDPDAAPPAVLPSVAHGENIYFVVPSDLDPPKAWDVHRVISDRAVLAQGVAMFPPADVEWPSDEEIKREIERHDHSVLEARWTRDARETLVKAGHDLYASAARIDDETPMLVEGLMRERGVSVFYGALDEFKTTLVLDIVAHVACGADWQGRKVEPRPVIWYALEGADEIPVRLRALEGRLRKKDTPWGDERLPVAVLDRIPDNYIGWRTELYRLAERWGNVYRARQTLGELPTEERKLTDASGKVELWTAERYPDPDTTGRHAPIVVIDTLSLALGSDDEKGPRAPGFINDCLDLLKKRPDLEPPMEVEYLCNEEARAQWRKETGREPDDYINFAVASHVVIIHHQTKTGVEFAGHRAIGANTQALYRVHRFGRFADARRPYAGYLTPYRVKGVPRPGAIRFEVEVVPVEGTRQTAAVVKDKAADIPSELDPVVAALRELEDHEQIPRATVNDCLDIVAAKEGNMSTAEQKGTTVAA